MAETEPRALREGSALKRAAILLAARELFLADGFDRTSVDAIAASAVVSKRTVYDYFGDKQTLLLAVVTNVGEALVHAIGQAITDHLVGATDLEEALVAFSSVVAYSTLGSPDYVAFTRLVAMESAQLPEFGGPMGSGEPEDMLAEQFQEFERRGLLSVPDARIAADHFVALAFSALFNNARPGAQPESEHMSHMIREGVRAFLRAYAPR